MESALGTGTRHEAQRRLCCASGPNLNSGQGRLARAFKLPWGSDTRVPQVGSTGRGFRVLVHRPWRGGPVGRGVLPIAGPGLGSPLKLRRHIQVA